MSDFLTIFFLRSGIDFFKIFFFSSSSLSWNFVNLPNDRRVELKEKRKVCCFFFWLNDQWGNIFPVIMATWIQLKTSRERRRKKQIIWIDFFLSFFFPRRELDKRVNTGKKRRNEKTVCINVYWYQTPMATTVTGHPEPTRFSPRRRDDDAYLHTRRSAKLWTSKILVGRIFSEMSMYRITSQMFLKS